MTTASDPSVVVEGHDVAPHREAPTSRDVARLAGVSQATVSRVLNQGSVSPETRRRVLEAVKTLGYYPNEPARSLITQESRTVGIIVSDILNDLIASILEQIEALLVSRGYRVGFTSTRRIDARAGKLVEVFLEQRVAGVILPFVTRPGVLVGELRSRRIPTALIGEASDQWPAAFVGVDDELGGRLAAEHLLSLGHTQMGCLVGPAHSSASRNRETGFRAALEDAEVDLPAKWVENGLFTYDGGRAATHRILSHAPEPTALFCANDMMAFGAIDAAAERHLVVPRDLSIVGFDDVPMSGWRRWSLTTVRQPVDRMTQAAVVALIASIERFRNDDSDRIERRIFQPELVCRATTAPPGRPSVRTTT